MASFVIRKRVSDIFPLKIAGRYLTTQQDVAFPIFGDTAWSLEVQCTRAQIRTYLEFIASLGFNAVLIEAFEHFFSSQTPYYRNAEGNDPFTTMSPVDFTSPNEAYWSLIDFIVDIAKSLGIVVFLTLAYYGFNANEGWQTELGAASNASLQSYGAFIGSRYEPKGNVILVLGGDNASGASIDAQIMTGLRSVTTSMIVTGHSVRGNDGYSKYSAQTGFNLNSQYSNNSNIISDAATCYGRSMPYVLLEGYYGNEHLMTPKLLRTQHWQTMLSGASGLFLGENPRWLMGGANNSFSDSGSVDNIGAAATLSSYLNTTAIQHQSILLRTVRACAWHKLVPKTGTELITTSKGSGTSAIVGAQASDASFAMVYSPGSNFTIDLSGFAHNKVPGVWIDPTDGSQQAASGSPFTNTTGTNAFTLPGANAAGDTDWTLRLG